MKPADASAATAEPARRQAFADELRQTFCAAAERAGGTVDRFFRLADGSARLSFAGDALVPTVTRSLAHLVVDPVPQASITIRLWDSVSTETAMPPPPWGLDDYREVGSIRGFFDHELSCVFTRALSVFDARADEGFYWIRAPRESAVPSPLRALFHLWLSSRRLQLVHAAAVGRSDGCVLMVGKSGSGKSTAALACLGSPLRYLSDDYCAVRPDDLTVFSLYSSAKTDRDIGDRLPFLAPLVTDGDPFVDGRALCFLNEHLSEHLLRTAPLRAILVPRVGRRATALVRTTAVSALAAMVPSTMFQLPGSGERAFRRLSRLAAEAPCYELEIGPDVREVPEVILGLLDD